MRGTDGVTPLWRPGTALRVRAARTARLGAPGAGRAPERRGAALRGCAGRVGGRVGVVDVPKRFIDGRAAKHLLGGRSGGTDGPERTRSSVVTLPLCFRVKGLRLFLFAPGVKALTFVFAIRNVQKLSELLR